MTSSKNLDDLLSIIEDLDINNADLENPKKSSQQDTNTKKEQGGWYLEISPNQLTVTLHLKPENSSTITTKQLIEELEKQNITYGIDWGACSSVENIKKETKIVIAQGTPCVPSINADVKIHFSTKSKEEIPIGENEKVDFKNRYKFTCARPGEVLAEKVPPTYGKPGTNVRGQIITPEPPRDIQLIAGSGAKINDDKNQIFSTIYGRPLVRRYKDMVCIDVAPLLKHDGDVDMATGNIQFYGDIIISGGVKDGLMVKSHGKIVVKGIVSNANLEAGDGVKVCSNVISSYIAANSVFSSVELYETIVKIRSNLEKLILAMKQILHVASLKKTSLFGPLFKALIDRKFKDLPTFVTSLYNNVRQIPQMLRPQGFLQFAEELMNSIVNYPLTIENMEQVEALLKKVYDWQNKSETSLSHKSHISIKYAQNSQIRASGDVLIFGDGCYNSSIKSGGDVNISGVFRGGKITAKNNVYIEEAGSQVGTRTDIYVGPNSQIVLDKVHSNTVVHFGKFTYKFVTIKEKVKVRQCKGRIILTHY